MVLPLVVYSPSWNYLKTASDCERYIIYGPCGVRTSSSSPVSQKNDSQGEKDAQAWARSYCGWSVIPWILCKWIAASTDPRMLRGAALWLPDCFMLINYLSSSLLMNWKMAIKIGPGPLFMPFALWEFYVILWSYCWYIHLGLFARFNNAAIWNRFLGVSAAGEQDRIEFWNL